MKKIREERKKINTEQVKRKRTSAVFLAPSILGVSLFFVLPFLVVIFYSVVNNPIQHKFVFLKNFVNVLNNSAFRLAAANTLKFSLIAVPLVVLLSMALAFALDTAIPFKSQIRTLLLSPMMVPIASVVLIWQVLFHYNGVVNEFMLFFGGTKIDWFKSDYAKIVLVLLFLVENYFGKDLEES